MTQLTHVAQFMLLCQLTWGKGICRWDTFPWRSSIQAQGRELSSQNLLLITKGNRYTSCFFRDRELSLLACIIFIKSRSSWGHWLFLLWEEMSTNFKHYFRKETDNLHKINHRKPMNWELFCWKPICQMTNLPKANLLKINLLNDLVSKLLRVKTNFGSTTTSATALCHHLPPCLGLCL